MNNVIFNQPLSDPFPNHIREVFFKAKCLYAKADVERAFDQIAVGINEKLANSNPIFLCVVVGGIVPLGNLLPRLDFPLEVDYIHATRYEEGLEGREVKWVAKPRCSLKNRTVVLVDDILDRGVTLAEIIHYCESQSPEKVYSTVLVDKQNARLPEGLQQADFCGLTVENHYVFGYGMDYKGYLRNAPGIYMVAAEHDSPK